MGKRNKTKQSSLPEESNNIKQPADAENPAESVEAAADTEAEIADNADAQLAVALEEAEAIKNEITGEAPADEDTPAEEESVAPDGEATAETAEPVKKVNIFKQIEQKLAVFGIPDMLLVRFVAVFFLISGYNLVRLRDDHNPVEKWTEFVPEVSFGLSVVMMAALFVILTVLYKLLPKHYKYSDQVIAIGGVLYFALESLWKVNNFYLSFSYMLVCGVFIYYCWCKIRHKKLFRLIPDWVSFIIVTAAAALVCGFVALTTVAKHKNFGTATHDFGLFVQMYHSLAKNLTAVTTCERDKFLSHFYVHSSYIYYTLVPIYKMFPYEATLLIAQAVLAMGGFIPMFLICKDHKFKGVSLIFMCFAYVFCTGLVGPCYYEFHENAFLPTLLMWLLWAVDKKRYLMFYIFSVLVCLVKEDAPLYVVCIGMYMFFRDKKDRKRGHGLIMAALSGAYMILITNWLTVHGDGQMMTSTRFGLLMIDKDGGFGEIIKNVLTDPAYFFSTFSHEETLPFFLQVMGPLLFLPFFTKKIYRYLLMLPFIIMNMVIGAGYGYAASIGFQYIFGPACLLIYMTIINLDDLGYERKQNLPLAIGSAAMMLTFGMYSYTIGHYISNKNDDGYLVELEAMLDRIPQDASVAGDTFQIPHFADRDEVYIFDNNDIKTETITTYDDQGNPITQEEKSIIDVGKYDYFVVPVGTEFYNEVTPLFARYGIEKVDECRGRVEIYKNPSYVPENGGN